MHQPINLKHKLSLITEQWQPKVIAEMNDYQFKVVKIEGDFIWHTHSETDEAFIVLDGILRIDFHDGNVLLAAGEMYVIPRGIEHKTSADIETQIMIIEPRGILNTGHEGGKRTANNDVWI
ncbi:cupin domain-containing protein [Xenorhabdus doucetiae]|uniref:Cupin 2 conserved barrel domain protein n=1 Tax=Xenorhabdus doucetiae TaxID=351671 RepID=A0A068QSA7_9GAMM|nr:MULTISPECIES: cupin domain-containing protein [Xenorhabdus]MBD2786034.1 cupin domain-containing protein [Xenorhabdus sp. 3]MBD2786901.1 cupin domain-containing protein [Xenorhabdus sp. DI]TYP03630.1 mannose-6-phosphate isomerase-like protein (cupin superfamily) [Xenorhabdus doucetiae]CDG17863.1 Cupin 2 conserved barrel domain protein [Xenorhabdus doucetiae]